jgi:hypothetical protein
MTHKHYVMFYTRDQTKGNEIVTLRIILRSRAKALGSEHPTVARDVFGHSVSAEYKGPSLNVRKFPFLEFSLC